MKKWALALIFIFTVGGCQKQSPGEIEPDYQDSLTDAIRAESCRNTELTNDLLEANNLKNLFKCTTWDQKFPAMYKSLEGMDVKAWNFFANPINEKIFNNKVLRDQLIELLNELDRLGGLDELGKVIYSLNESNFYKNLFEVLACAKTGEPCPGRNRIQREDILNFFSLFSLDKGEVKTLSKLGKGFSLALSLSQAFPASLRKELKKDSFKSNRLELLDMLFKKISDENFVNDLTFYKNILSEKDEVGEVWLRSLFEQKILAEDFDYLLFYPVDIQRNMWQDFRLLGTAMESDLVCEPKAGFNGLKIDVSEHLKAFLTDLFGSTQDKFFQKTIQSVGLIKTATQMCSELSGYGGRIRGYKSTVPNYEHRMDFVSALSSSSRLLLHKGFYELFQKFQVSHPLGGPRELFILENFSDDFFISFLNMIKTFDRGTAGPIYTGHQLVKSLNSDFYESLLDVVVWAQGKEEGDYKSLGRVWEALSEEGKLFFINFFDAHYKNEADVSLLMGYYSSTLDVANEPIADLLELFFSRKNEAQEAVFLESLESVTSVLSSPDLLADFDKFFSRGHILELLKIISSGFVSQETSNSIADIYILEPETRPLPRVDFSRELSMASEKCLARISEPQVSFYSLISLPPVECKSFAAEDPLIKSFFALSDFSLYLSDSGGEGLTRAGVLSPSLLNNYVSVFKSISEKYGAEGEDGLYNVLKKTNRYFKNPAARDNLALISEGLDVLGEDSGLVELASKHFGEDENYPVIPSLVAGLEQSISAYQGYLNGSYSGVVGPTNFSLNSKYQCKNFHNELGGRSCPSADEISTIASRLIKRALKKNEEFPTALEQMLKMISVDYGLKIPYLSEKPRNKIVTLEESLRMFYNFTEPSIATNRLSQEMQIYPSSIDNYFQDANWRVTRDQAQSELETVNRVLNTMERVEVVVRDVRFDENYLGAHYMNSVAKAEDYNKTVESKYGLLKKCVPLKFCGKFMNKAQHGMAKNSRDTFPSLLDANTKNGWRHGDYMQALLSSLVGSSPKIAQVSSVIRKKVVGIRIDVPYLQTKKQLRDHNGKILGLVSMVSGFSNIARLIRDRVGRTPESFKSFLTSRAVDQVSSTLLKNYKAKSDAPKIANLVRKAESNGFLRSMIDYFYEADYEKQRLAENILFKGMHVVSFIGGKSARHRSLGLTTLLDVADTILTNYENISEVVGLDDTETLVDINHFLDVLVIELEKRDTAIPFALNEAIYFVQKNSSRLQGVLDKLLSSKNKLTKLKDAFIGTKKLLADLESKKFLTSVTELSLHLRTDSKVQLSGFQNLLKVSGSKRICVKGDRVNSELVCRENKQVNELGRTLRYLSSNRASNLLGIIDYFGRQDDLDQSAFFSKIFPSLTIY